MLGRAYLVASVFGELEILDLVRLAARFGGRRKCVHRFCDRAHFALHSKVCVDSCQAVFISGTASAFFRDVLRVAAAALRFAVAAKRTGPFESGSGGRGL